MTRSRDGIGGLQFWSGSKDELFDLLQSKTDLWATLTTLASTNAAAIDADKPESVAEVLVAARVLTFLRSIEGRSKLPTDDTKVWFDSHGLWVVVGGESPKSGSHAWRRVWQLVNGLLEVRTALSAEALETCRLLGSSGKTRRRQDESDGQRPRPAMHASIRYEGPLGMPTGPLPFSGRTEHLQSLNTIGAPDGPAALILWGTHGTGKTFLTRAFVATQAAREQFPLGIRWLEAERLADDVERLSREFCPELPEGASYIERQRALAHAFSDRAPELLLIFDGVQEVHLQHLPLPSHGARVLITTTHRELVSKLPMASVSAIKLGGFTPDESLEYFDSLGGSVNAEERRVVARLFRAVGQLPWAVRILSHQILRPGTSPEEILSSVDLTLFEADEPGSGRSLAETFRLAIEPLRPTDVAVLCALASCAGPADLSLVSSIVGSDERTCVRSLQRLHSLCLAEFDGDTGEVGRWRLHDVTRRFARRLKAFDDARKAHLSVVEKEISYTARAPLAWLDEILFAASGCESPAEAHSAAKMLWIWELLESGKHPGQPARALYERLSGIAPNDPLIAFALADCLCTSGETAAARRLILRWNDAKVDFEDQSLAEIFSMRSTILATRLGLLARENMNEFSRHPVTPGGNLAKLLSEARRHAYSTLAGETNELMRSVLLDGFALMNDLRARAFLIASAPNLDEPGLLATIDALQYIDRRTAAELRVAWAKRLFRAGQLDRGADLLSVVADLVDEATPCFWEARYILVGHMMSKPWSPPEGGSAEDRAPPALRELVEIATNQHSLPILQLHAWLSFSRCCEAAGDTENAATSYDAILALIGGVPATYASQVALVSKALPVYGAGPPVPPDGKKLTDFARARLAVLRQGATIPHDPGSDPGSQNETAKPPK